MKKSIAVILALILMMTALFFGCGKKDDEQTDVNADQTTASSYQNETSHNGEVTTSGVANIPPAGADITTSTAPASGVQQPSSEPAVTTTEPLTTTEPVTTTKPVPSTNPSSSGTQSGLPSGNTQQGNTSDAYRIDKCQKIFASGTYQMTVLMEEDGLEEMPMTLSCKNGNMCISMNMDGMAIKMIYRAENDTMYMLIDFLGIYSDVTEDMMGDDFDFSEMTEQFLIEYEGDITVSKTQFNGKNVTCESYVKNGETVKFYFDANDVFVGREDIEKDGSVSVSKVTGFSDSVSDSVFEIPDSYKYVNLSALMNMGA